MALDGLSSEQHEACFELYHDPHAAVRARNRIQEGRQRKEEVIDGQPCTNHTIAERCFEDTKVLRCE